MLVVPKDVLKINCIDPSLLCPLVVDLLIAYFESVS